MATKTNKQYGHVKGQPMRFVNGHHNRRPRPERRLGLDRWHEEDRGHGTPCHIWEGAKNSHGYGHFREPGTRKMRTVHVVLWEREHGPVPDGLELDHLCRVKSCVNTDHLEPVTHQENMRRAYAGVS